LERKELVEKIVEFCFETGLFDESLLSKIETKVMIESCLEKVEMVETIINIIILKSRTYKNLDIKKLKVLLIELENVRLDLEYKL